MRLYDTNRKVKLNPIKGCKLQILISLSVLKTESQYFYPYRYRLG